MNHDIKKKGSYGVFASINIIQAENEKKKLLHSILMLLCAASMAALPVGVKAEEITDEKPIYYDTEQGRFVNVLDEYLSQLNAGVIIPHASTIEEHESEITLYDGIISDPSKECSNIFGHKWGTGQIGKNARQYTALLVLAHL